MDILTRNRPPIQVGDRVQITSDHARFQHYADRYGTVTYVSGHDVRVRVDLAACCHHAWFSESQLERDVRAESMLAGGRVPA